MRTLLTSTACACVAFATVRAQQTPAVNDSMYVSCSGYRLEAKERGDMCFTLWSYMRYLNQQGLNHTYTDAFGRTIPLKLRQDIQNQKVTFTFKGWVYDHKLRYNFFIWTANTSQGDPAQVVVSGSMTYQFAKEVAVGAGTISLPTTRTTQGTFPNWLKIDHRTVADEFFRGSYTMGVWADGEIARGLKYRVMLGNNLSQLGVDAVQLDAGLNTVSSAVWWMPTTGEFGPMEGYGDFEHHDRLATFIAARFTHSREDAQSQPSTNDIENSQLRVSDGTNIFTPGAFAPGAQIRRATYGMLSADAAMKYRGSSIDVEFYWRWLNHFTTVGDTIPITSLYDRGYQIQASRMLLPKTLQLYVAGSKILGEYGNPWDLGGGVAFFPTKRVSGFKIVGQALHLSRSPVGGAALPFPVGANGMSYTLDVWLAF